MLARSTVSVNNALRDVVVPCVRRQRRRPRRSRTRAPRRGRPAARRRVRRDPRSPWRSSRSSPAGPGRDERAVLLAVVVLVANAVAYLLSRTTGLPLLIPDPEEVDLLGVATTLAEVLAAVAGVLLITRKEQS